MTPFQNAYVITTRTSPCYSYYANITPLPQGEMWFYTAPGQYQAEACAYEPIGPASSTAPVQFVSALTADVQTAIANGCPQVTLLIHGLADLFTDTVHDLSVVGTGLRQYASVLAGCSWPSTGQATARSTATCITRHFRTRSLRPRRRARSAATSTAALPPSSTWLASCSRFSRAFCRRRCS